MREIDNNKLNSVNFTGIQKASNDGNEIPETPVVPTETKELNDLSAIPAASLGKSQVSAVEDSTARDMKFLEENPALAKALIESIDKYAETHTADETLQLIEKAHQEFVSKK